MLNNARTHTRHTESLRENYSRMQIAGPAAVPYVVAIRSQMFLYFHHCGLIRHVFHRLLFTQSGAIYSDKLPLSVLCAKATEGGLGWGKTTRGLGDEVPRS